MNATKATPSTNGKHQTLPADDTARLTRVVFWLPQVAKDDAEFLDVARRVVAECDPTTALQEHAVARILRGLWRMRPLLAANNNELDEKKLAAAEQSQARAEASWCRLRRQELAEARAQERSGRAERKEKKSDSPSALRTPWGSMPVARHPDLPPKPGPLPDYEPPPELPPDAPIDWHDYIHVDPAITPEFAIFKGTTVLVESVVASLLDTTTEERVLELLPFLTRTQLRAAMLCDKDGQCVVERPPPK